ncbi:MAG: RecQ family ATP-dependent DNA helicase [Treponema sp.]|nr:RecQ family ATP-dependent DNA helicase [Treponema sp.]
MHETTDPLNCAAARLFGVSYLFPYQRLVMANILEAAEAAGLALNWPCEDEPAAHGDSTIKDGYLDGDADSALALSDRGDLGRQIVILPTGAGKSLCFQLPAMIIEGITLVIYPILSLMADQKRRLDERGFAPVVLRGGQTKEERDEIWQKLESGESKFVIANPEVLLTPQVMNRFASDKADTKSRKPKVAHIVIDEAHCVSEWGESFRPAYLEIKTIIENINAPLVTAFTATAGSSVLEKINKYIFGTTETHRGAHLVMGNPDRANISYFAKGCVVRDMAVRDLLLRNSLPAIVFCSSRAGTERLSRYLGTSLREMGVSWYGEIRFYHAGLNRAEKYDVEKWFMGSSQAVLCATCAYGMGIDKADIRTVIHRDCAPSVEAYLQESGRAGRDGKPSRAFLLWGPEDKANLRRVKTEADKARLSRLLDYARDTTQCRRQALLKMLDYHANGESPETPCCDVCEEQASPVLREEASILDFFRRNRRCYTVNEAARILARTENFFWSEDEAKQVVNHFIHTGRLVKSRNVFWKGAVSLGKVIER